MFNNLSAEDFNALVEFAKSTKKHKANQRTTPFNTFHLIWCSSIHYCLYIWLGGKKELCTLERCNLNFWNQCLFRLFNSILIRAFHLCGKNYCLAVMYFIMWYTLYHFAFIRSNIILNAFEDLKKDRTDRTLLANRNSSEFKDTDVKVKRKATKLRSKVSTGVYGMLFSSFHTF